LQDQLTVLLAAAQQQGGQVVPVRAAR
jgi:hypothetical protein